MIPPVRLSLTWSTPFLICSRIARTKPYGPSHSSACPDVRKWPPVVVKKWPAANTRGNMPRNALTGPGLINSDVSLVKGFKLAPNRTLQVRLEAFNLFDRANFAIPSGRVVFTNAAGDVSPTFGRITSTTTTARQVQLGLKYLF